MCELSGQYLQWCFAKLQLASCILAAQVSTTIVDQISPFSSMFNQYWPTLAHQCTLVIVKHGCVCFITRGSTLLNRTGILGLPSWEWMDLLPISATTGMQMIIIPKPTCITHPENIPGMSMRRPHPQVWLKQDIFETNQRGSVETFGHRLTFEAFSPKHERWFHQRFVGFALAKNGGTATSCRGGMLRRMKGEGKLLTNPISKPTRAGTGSLDTSINQALFSCW